VSTGYLESFLGDSVTLIIAGKVPDNDGLVPGRREYHIGVFRRGSQSSDPAIVTYR
jgi:hypothetical protein